MIGRIMPIVLLLLALAIFVGYVNPTYTKHILVLQSQIKQYNSTLAAAGDFNRKESELATARTAIPADAIARLQAFLPDGVDNVQLILDLNSLAAKTGIQLSNFDIQSSVSASADQSSGALPLETSARATDSIDVTVSATGTYSSFRAFLDGVERSLRPLDLVQMTLTDSATGVYTYNLTFRIYWMR